MGLWKVCITEGIEGLKACLRPTHVQSIALFPLAVALPSDRERDSWTECARAAGED